MSPTRTWHCLGDNWSETEFNKQSLTIFIVINADDTSSRYFVLFSSLISSPSAFMSWSLLIRMFIFSSRVSKDCLSLEFIILLLLPSCVEFGLLSCYMWKVCFHAGHFFQGRPGTGAVRVDHGVSFSLKLNLGVICKEVALALLLFMMVQILKARILFYLSI